MGTYALSVEGLRDSDGFNVQSSEMNVYLLIHIGAKSHRSVHPLRTITFPDGISNDCGLIIFVFRLMRFPIRKNELLRSQIKSLC
jgi:hypothetical protein